MAALTLVHARALIDAALASARQHGYKPMGVVVVDAAAQVVASAREDGASALRLDIALGKAGAAVGMGAHSRATEVHPADRRGADPRCGRRDDRCRRRVRRHR